MNLQDALLDSWDRNNKILVNLLERISASGLQSRAAKESPTVASLFAHIHYVRLVFIEEDAPEFAVAVPRHEWTADPDPHRLAADLNASAKIVRNAVQGRLDAGRAMDLHYDHPILLLQHMIWHEGYHHGQIKLALKLAGTPLSDDDIGPLTWDVWMRKANDK